MGRFSKGNTCLKRDSPVIIQNVLMIASMHSCLCAYVCTCVPVYMCVYACVLLCVHLCVSTCLSLCVQVCVYVSLCMCFCVYLSLCIYLCLCLAQLGQNVHFLRSEFRRIEKEQDSEELERNKS